jgi:hypothetical protein
VCRPPDNSAQQPTRQQNCFFPQPFKVVPHDHSTSTFVFILLCIRRVLPISKVSLPYSYTTHFALLILTSYYLHVSVSTGPSSGRTLLWTVKAVIFYSIYYNYNKFSYKFHYRLTCCSTIGFCYFIVSITPKLFSSRYFTIQWVSIISPIFWLVHFYKGDALPVKF